MRFSINLGIIFGEMFNMNAVFCDETVYSFIHDVEYVYNKTTTVKSKKKHEPGFWNILLLKGKKIGNGKTN